MYNLAQAPNVAPKAPAKPAPAPQPVAPQPVASQGPARPAAAIAKAPAAIVKADRKTVVRSAALALLVFSLLTTLTLVVWFRFVADPWGWKPMVAVLNAALGFTTAVLLWRAPSRAHAVAGAAVMLLSLARAGGPGDWGWSTGAFVLVTCALMIPVVRAALLLRSE